MVLFRIFIEIRYKSVIEIRLDKTVFEGTL